MSKFGEGKNSVLILYPWGIDSVRNRSMGAGLRVGLLSEFLRDQGYAVTVASVGLRSLDISSGGIRFIECRHPSNPVLLLLYGLALALIKLADAHALRALLYFNFPLLDRPFALCIRELAASHAHVLLEYPFWRSILEAPDIILTNHDIISESWAGRPRNGIGRLLYRSVLQHELSAMKSRGRTVVVSESDRRFFVSQGAGNPEVIINPVHIPESKTTEAVGPKGRDGTQRPRAIFIGGGWYPNVHAARIIVRDIAPNCPEFDFLLAGACARGLSRIPQNVLRTGVVSSAMLGTLYHDATYAIIPLQEGTGSSLKTIEALSYGKVVISTSAGVRGFDFRDSVHGIICDDVRRFPDILRQLDANSEWRAELSRNAIELAKRYDYRVVFRKYLEIMHRPCEKLPVIPDPRSGHD